MAASKYTQKWNENELKRRLYAIYKSHFQSSNSEEDEDEEKWTTSIYNCKQCKGTFKYLSLHLKKKPKCGHEYAEEEVKDIRAGIKILAKESKKISRRDYYERNKEDRQKKYQANREEILKKKRTSYWKNRDKYVDTRAEYYDRNKEILSDKKKKKYQDSKNKSTFTIAATLATTTN